MISTPAPAPEVPTETDGQTEAERTARSDAKKAAAQARGRESTILTGALGDTSQATTQKKTLLGE
ncbi:hypothetical protein [Desulfovibrio sp. X2]|uniref:hypothetical protein n=1 Tax=Desulfovibrio sp. X2 TaxID=941449 RepID=UPI0003FD5728|nr:hypothetical protein [Desulfovibrio sp. X2]